MGKNQRALFEITCNRRKISECRIARFPILLSGLFGQARIIWQKWEKIFSPGCPSKRPWRCLGSNPCSGSLAKQGKSYTYMEDAFLISDVRVSVLCSYNRAARAACIEVATVH